MRELRRLKADRRAAQSDPEAIDQGERAEHIAALLLAEGLANPPPPGKLTAGPEAPVSPHDPETQHTKTETPPRQPAPTPVISRRPQRDTAIPPEPERRAFVSPHDLRTRKHKTETAGDAPTRRRPPRADCRTRSARLTP